MDSQTKIEAATEPTPEQAESIDANEPVQEAKPKQRRGLACVDPERRRAIASSGGRAAQAAGTAYRFTTEEARIAGQRGGLAPHASRGRKKSS